MKLRTKITTGLLILYALLLILYFLVIYPFIYKEFLNQEEEKISYFTKSVVTSLNNYVEFIINDVKYISSLDQLKSLQSNEILKILSFFTNRFSYIASYSLYNNSENLLIKTANKIYNSNQKNKFTISVSNPVYDNQNKVIGILKGEFLFDNNNIGNNNWILEPDNYKWHSILTDKKGFVIYDSDIDVDKLNDKQRNYSNYASVKNALIGKWGLNRIKIDKTIWYSSSEFIPDVDWIFIIEIPRLLVLKQLGKIVLPSNILVFVFLSLLFILIIILSDRFIKPLQELTSTLKQYGIDGNVNKIQIKSSSEIKEAINAFNSMISERDKLEKEVLEITEKERFRIGIDLHDDLGQILTGIAFQIVLLEEECKKNSDLDISVIKEASELIEEAIKKTKLIARGLCPVNLFNNGLSIAIEEFLKDIEELYNIKYKFINEVDNQIKDDIICVNLFYIIKEAVNNSIKHSKASTIEIKLFKENLKIQIIIKDNGSGFDFNKIKLGLGFRTMKYRARLINAELDIRSIRESGTEIFCSINNNLGVKH